MISVLWNAIDSIVCKLEFASNSTFIEFVKQWNEFLQVFVTFDVIKISSIFWIFTYFQIVSKLESYLISTLVWFMQFGNAYDDMIWLFDGIEISLMS